MGSSSEEEKLVQMVRDFIESETPDSCFSASSNSVSLTTTTHVLSLKDILGNRTKAEEEVVESVVKLMRGKEEEDPKKLTPSLKKWLVINLNINGFSASLCHTSWVTSTACPAGDYEYIEIKVEEDEEKLGGGSGVRVIVDIDFRSQFEVARPSQGYTQLIQTLPSIFVGTEKKLVRIISILCSAAKQSLRESGLHLPPWRTTTYMQCKWLSSNSGSSTSFDTTESEQEEHSHGFGKWIPPMVKMKKKKKKRGLSSQFSNMSINCC